MNIEKFLTELKGMDVVFCLNEPMSKHTSFSIGGPADVFVEADDVCKVADIISLAKLCQVPFEILGNGSNLLVSDKGIEGAVIKLCDETVTVDGCAVTCAAGAKLTRVAAVARDNSLGGLEFGWGIPGTVGGAVYMNAGAYGGEVKQVIKSCTSLDMNGNIITRNVDEMLLDYRTSVYKTNGEIILKAEFELKYGDINEISATMDDYMNRRKSKQPLELPSAGSTFKRPVGYFAGALIEQCGLKGFRVGDAAVSEKHAGFVVNLGNATCDDVLKLIEHVKCEVKKNTGVELEPEVIFKGR